MAKPYPPLHSARALSAATQERAKREGRVFIPPYDDPYVIAGQGTIGTEILRQTHHHRLDAIFVAVGVPAPPLRWLLGCRLRGCARRALVHQSHAARQPGSIQSPYRGTCEADRFLDRFLVSSNWPVVCCHCSGTVLVCLHAAAAAATARLAPTHQRMPAACSLAHACCLLVPSSLGSSCCLFVDPIPHQPGFLLNPASRSLAGAAWQRASPPMSRHCGPRSGSLAWSP